MKKDKVRKYAEKRVLAAESVNTLCRNKAWYTKGTGSEYQALLEKVEEIRDTDESITTDQIGELAEDIKKHSITDYPIESIMWELNRAANTFFYIA